MKRLLVFLLSLIDYCLWNTFMAVWFRSMTFKEIHDGNKQFFNMED